MILLFMVREGSPLVKWGRGVRVDPPVFQEPENGHFLAANDEREPADDPCGGEASDLRFGQETLCEDDGTVAAREPLRSLREVARPRQPMDLPGIDLMDPQQRRPLIARAIDRLECVAWPKCRNQLAGNGFLSPLPRDPVGVRRQ